MLSGINQKVHQTAKKPQNHLAGGGKVDLEYIILNLKAGENHVSEIAQRHD